MNNKNSIWQLIDDLKIKKGISEIIINDEKTVYIERSGEMIRLAVELMLSDFDSFCEDVASFNKSDFGPNDPIIDGSLPDGSRINIISSLYTKKTPAITIRKYLSHISSFDELDGKFGISPKWITFFKCLVKARKNIIVSGGTNVGKTTFMNLLMKEIFPNERVVIIEDTSEIKCSLKNKVNLVASHNRSQIESPLEIRDLIKNSLRMRPDRIIIGEVRGGEAFDLLQAMNTGHDGSMTTLHANSTAEALMRLESLFSYSGYDVPTRAIRKQLSVAIDFVIQLGKSKSGDRIVKTISEVAGMEGDVILLQDIGTSSETGPVFTGLVPKSISSLVSYGLDEDFFVNI